MNIGFKVGDFIYLMGRSMGVITFAFVSVPRFTVVFLPIVISMVVAAFVMVNMTKKYTVQELKSYGKAGAIAQEVLSSMRTILAFGIQKESIKNYEDNLKEAEKMAIKKGIYSGLFGGISTALFTSCYMINIMYATYLVRIDCRKYTVSELVKSFSVFQQVLLT